MKNFLIVRGIDISWKYGNLNIYSIWSCGNGNSIERVQYPKYCLILWDRKNDSIWSCGIWRDTSRKWKYLILWDLKRYTSFYRKEASFPCGDPTTAIYCGREKRLVFPVGTLQRPYLTVVKRYRALWFPHFTVRNPILKLCVNSRQDLAVWKDGREGGFFEMENSQICPKSPSWLS